MIEFDVFRYVRYSDTLLKLQYEIEQKEENGVSLTPQEQQNFSVLMNEIRNFLTDYEINTGRCFNRIDVKIHQPEMAKPKLSTSILELRNRIYDGLGERMFMFIPAKDAEYYNHFALFGQEVATNFPKANKEITAAGNCYATGNYTACVFHLMRAVEYGARKMVIAMNVQGQLGKPIELCDWGDLVRVLEEGLKALSNGSRKKVHKKATFEFYNHAVAQFRNFKDAWRNNVSHTRKTYQPGITKDILDNTRQFMQHLATRLKE